MMKITDKIKSVYEVAAGVRRWAQWVRMNYIPLTWASSRLEGLCAIVSYKLFLELKKDRFSPRFMMNCEHSFVELSGMVVDVTATQFSPAFPPVALAFGESRERMYEWGDVEGATTVLGIKRMPWLGWGDGTPTLPEYRDIMKRPIKKRRVTDRTVADSITRTNRAVRIVQ